MRRIALLTSGGDAPGMNAAIRAVVRAGIHYGLEVYGVRHGYAGMIEGDMERLEAHSVSNIIQRGGTMLKTARSRDFKDRHEKRAMAVEHMRAKGIDALVAIGGDGTFEGASVLQEEFRFPVIGVPGTIDNDLAGTDYTIGFDTAVNTALDAVDKIRDTADAFERTFYIEVMGRSSGFIAAEVALACGAEYVIIPEKPVDYAHLSQHLTKMRSTKRSSIIIVAEGAKPGALDIAKNMRAHYGTEFRVCILGHIQRGGAPSARDRILAGTLGAAAVEAALEGAFWVMVGEVNGEVVRVPLAETWKSKKPTERRLVDLIEVLGE